MVAPSILPGMIEADEARRTADPCAGVGAFGDIAAQAGEGEIDALRRLARQLRPVTSGLAERWALVMRQAVSIEYQAHSR